MSGGAAFLIGSEPNRSAARLKCAVGRALLLSLSLLCACSQNPGPAPADNSVTPNENSAAVEDIPSFKQIVARAEENAENGQSGDELGRYGHRWFYGDGLGRTIANVGTIVVFPPYALYVLGNAGLALAGYPQMEATSVLPDPAKNLVQGFYNGVTSVPGRVTSVISGEKFEGQYVH